MIEAFDCVVAADRAGGIGHRGDLPWPKLKGDLRFLRETTSAAPEGRRNAVIMGRKTWDSVPARFRPLPGRLNIVISRQALELGDEAVAARTLDGALDAAVSTDDVDRTFVIGGAEIFRLAFAHPRCRDVYLTRIDATYECDAFLPPMDDFELAETLATHHEAGVDYRIERWHKRPRVAP
jgi:dihydrofolate reductase